MVIGDRMRERREVAGLSQSELGRRLKLNQSTIAKLENGEAQGSSHLHKIARAIGTTPAYLTGETDDPTSDSPDVDLSPEEEKLLETFRRLPKDDRETIRRLIDRMSVGETQDVKPTLHAGRQSYRSGKSGG